MTRDLERLRDLSIVLVAFVLLVAGAAVFVATSVDSHVADAASRVGAASIGSAERR